MLEVKRKIGAAGARNPKAVRITVSLAPQINKRLEEVADQLGQNKGATASMALSIGLSMLDERSRRSVGYFDDQGRHIEVDAE